MSTVDEQQWRRAASLRRLHQPGQPVILANVWDAASARAVVRAGFPAVATASAAVAPTLGYDDHEAAPPEAMFAAAARIAAAVSRPVTVDAEAGYGLSASELVERVLATGAVGCNLEDSNHRTGELTDLDEQADYLAGVRAAARSAGVDLVLNARVDVFLQQQAGVAQQCAETIRRARRYLAAGADCVYPIRASGVETITTLVNGIDGCVNVLYRPVTEPGSVTLAQLAQLGVARVSFGPGLHQASQTALTTMLDHLAAGRDPYNPT